MGKLDELRGLVRSCLTTFLTDVEEGEDGGFSFLYESTNIHLVLDESDFWTTVTLFTVTNHNVPRSGALNKYVAEWGQLNVFGGMSLFHNDDGTDHVNLNWSLFGMHLHPDDLTQAVTTFSIVADKVDDEVQGLFGGRKFIG